MLLLDVSFYYCIYWRGKHPYPSQRTGTMFVINAMDKSIWTSNTNNNVKYKYHIFHCCTTFAFKIVLGILQCGFTKCGNMMCDCCHRQTVLPLIHQSLAKLALGDNHHQCHTFWHSFRYLSLENKTWTSSSSSCWMFFSMLVRRSLSI